MAKKPKSEPMPENEPEAPLPEGFRAEDMVMPDDVQVFEGKTLSGDVRDMLLTHMRSMTVPWAMLNEEEQGNKIMAASECGETVVRLCLQAMAKRKLPAISVSVGAYKVDKALEIKLAAAPSVGNITLMAEHGHAGALLILAEASDYFGERAAQRPDKDQPELPIEPQGDDA